MNFSWTGRQLDSITKSDGAVVSFTYDANGMRTEKTMGDESFGYVWQNGKLLAETYVNGTDSREVYYIYDENGSPVAWSYLDEYYYYIKNQQGDILGFTDSEGNVVVTYEYDAWGNLLSYTGTWYLAEYNSLRYRGYAYDVETGLYYLQSRYYDPKVGRFINADDTDYLGVSGTVLSYNLYAYCENNYVNCMDPKGNFVIQRWMVSAVADAALALIPGIGGLFAPVKTIAKAYGKAALKAKIAGPLGSLIKFICKNAAKLLYGLKNLLGKLWGVGKWVANKIPVEKAVNIMAGAASSMAINKFINVLIPNIDIVLSVGGMFSGFLDYVFDKNINNSIWVI